ncbi:MAG: macro domain-containing protein [Actinomycetota bacterium]
MSEIRYVVGDATSPEGDGEKVIVHICNDIGGWGAGFVLAISRRWPEPEAHYRAWFEGRAGNDFSLGAVCVVSVAPGLYVANLIGQRDVVAGPDRPPVRYDAIEAGLTALADELVAMDGSAHMPRIGCGLAGGDWGVVSSIVDRTLVDRHVPVTVYDLPS